MVDGKQAGGKSSDKTITDGMDGLRCRKVGFYMNDVALLSGGHRPRLPPLAETDVKGHMGGKNSTTGSWMHWMVFRVARAINMMTHAKFRFLMIMCPSAVFAFRPLMPNPGIEGCAPKSSFQT